MFKKLILLIAITCTVTPVLAQRPDLTPFEVRTFELFIPEDLPDEPVPLLMVLHGSSGTGAGTQEWLQFDALAAEAGVIVVYPDGLFNSWDFGPGIITEDGMVSSKDAEYLLWLVRRLQAEFPIDANRVFVTGISNGANMSYQLSCTYPDAFAGVAGVAALVSSPVARDCVDLPVPTLFIHGTDDPILPWDRQVNEAGQVVTLSAPESFQFWAARNGCEITEDALTTEEVPDTVTDDESFVIHMSLDGCEGSQDVQFYGVIGGGHRWPGKPFNSEIDLGVANMDLDATTVIMEWFLNMPPREQVE